MANVRRSLTKGLIAASVIAAAGVGLSPATASADITPTTVVNGILSTVGGCQTPVRSLILACTSAETLTRQSPVLLDLNPVGTNNRRLGCRPLRRRHDASDVGRPASGGAPAGPSVPAVSDHHKRWGSEGRSNGSQGNAANGSLPTASTRAGSPKRELRGRQSRMRSTSARILADRGATGGGCGLERQSRGARDGGLPRCSSRPDPGRRRNRCNLTSVIVGVGLSPVQRRGVESSTEGAAERCIGFVADSYRNGSDRLGGLHE